MAIFAFDQCQWMVFHHIVLPHLQNAAPINRMGLMFVGIATFEIFFISGWTESDVKIFLNWDRTVYWALASPKWDEDWSGLRGLGRSRGVRWAATELGVWGGLSRAVGCSCPGWLVEWRLLNNSIWMGGLAKLIFSVSNLANLLFSRCLRQLALDKRVKAELRITV